MLMLRFVDFALELCSEMTDGSSPLMRATAARDICSEALDELQKRVDLLRDWATCQNRHDRPQKASFPKAWFSAPTRISTADNI